MPESALFREHAALLRLLSEKVYNARLSTGQIRDTADFHAWLVKVSELAEQSSSLAEFFEQI